MALFFDKKYFFNNIFFVKNEISNETIHEKTKIKQLTEYRTEHRIK